MDAIEAVARAIRESLDDLDLTHVAVARPAHAAVTALAAQGDVTDEQIIAVIDECFCDPERGMVSENEWKGEIEPLRAARFRALLARQAAVHATHLNSVRDESERRRDAAERYYEAAERNLARAEAAEATVERVRALRDAPTDHLPFAAVMVADLRAALADPKADAAMGRYQEALDAGLSDHEAREDGWPTIDPRGEGA